MLDFNRDRLVCSGSRRYWLLPDLTLSGPYQSSMVPGNCGTNDRSQGTADIGRRPRAAMNSREQQLKGLRRHTASTAIECQLVKASNSRCRPTADFQNADLPARELPLHAEAAQAGCAEALRTMPWREVGRSEARATLIEKASGSAPRKHQFLEIFAQETELVAEQSREFGIGRREEYLPRPTDCQMTQVV